MDDFMIVDKTFGSIQTLLGITSGYGYSTNVNINIKQYKNVQ